MNKLYTKIFGLSLVFFLFGAISNQSLNAQCPTAGAANKSHTDISCFGADDGTITVEMTDGTAPFQFDLYDNNTGTFVTLSVTENQLPDGRTVIYSDVPPSSYQVVVFKAGCTPVQVSDGFTGFLIEEPSLLSANVVSITNDCDGTGSGAIDIDVAGGTAPYSFAWSGPTAGIGDTDNPINLNAGAYDVVVTDDNGCTTNINGVTVDVGPNAGVFTGTNGAACNDSAFDLTSLLDGSQDAGGSWSDDDTSGATITGNNADFTGIAAGTYNFTYTVTGAGSCLDDTETVTVDVTEAANAGVYVGTAGAVCDTDVAFDLTTLLDGSQDGGGSWADTNTSGATITGNSADFTGVAAGTYQFTYTVTGTGPCGDDSEVVEVTVSEAPNAGVFTGTNGAACNDSAFDLTSLLDGSQDAGGSWSDDNTSGATITGNNADFTGIAAGTYNFTYTVTGAGSCLDDTETVTVDVTEAANAGVYVGTAGAVCDTDVAFDLTTLLDGSQDGGGSWADTNTSGATITGNSADFTGVAAGTYQFTYTVTGTGPCGDDSEVVEVTVSEAPNAGVFTGTNGAACNDSAFDLTSLLDGSQDAGGSWSDDNTSGATITGNNADFTGIAAGTYNFTYTVTGAGSCLDDTETVTVDVTEAANAGVYVGTAGAVCDTDVAFDLTTLLDGSQDGGGSWADTNTSGATITGNSADFTGVAAGTYQFTYTVTGTGPCGDDSEVVEVTVSEAPNAGVFTGTNGAACNDSAFDLTSLLDGSQDAGGSWSDDNTSGATITGNNADFTGIAAGTYNFTYTVTGAGSCLDDTETVTVDVTEAANAGVYVGTAGAVCDTDVAFDLTTLLDGSQDGGGSWADTNTSGATITGNSADFTGVAAGTYQFTYTVTGTGPCGDDSEVVEVTVSEAPNAGVFTGTNGAACNDSAFDLTSLLDGSQDAGGSWSDDDTSGATITGNNADFTGIAAGTYNFTYTVTGAGSCLDDTETVTVDVTEAANAGVYVGTAGAVCDTDVAFDLTTLLDGSQDGGGSWADTNTSGATITGNSADFTGVAAGTYQFTYTVTGTGPCGDDSEVVEVTVSEAPNAGVFTGTNGAACNDSAFDLTSLLDGSQDAGGSWSDDNTSGATITGNNADFTGIAAGTYNFTYTVTGAGSCLDDTETVTVDVTEAANAGVYVGTAGAVCDTDVAFDLTTLLDGSQDGGGSWADTNTSGATITGNSADFTGVAAGTYQFTYTVTGTGPCGDDSEVVEVTVSEAPNAGVFTGTNGAACNDSAFDLTSLLDGSQDAGGSWSDDNTSGATITGNNADFTGIAAGTYNFTYTVTGAGSCLDDTETVTVDVTEAANAGVYVGTAGAVCDTDVAFDLTTLLDGSQDGGGSWADTNTSGATITGNSADFTGVAAGTYQFTYTVTGTGPCGDDSEVVEVTVSEAPNAGVFTGTNGAACNDSAFDLTSLLDGSQDAGGSWSDDNTSGATITGNNADFTGIAAGTYNFTYTVTGAGSCLDDTETVTVDVTEAANAGVYVGTAGAVCDTDVAFDLTTLLDGSQDGGGSWADTNTSGATITGNSADFTGVAAGTYQFTYTVTGTGPCGDDSEVVEVTVSEAPNAGVFTGTNGAACNDSAFDLTSLLDGSQDAGGSWSDDNTSGATITGNNADFTGIAAGTYNFTYTVTGAGSCLDDTETVTVDVTEAANAGVYVGTAGAVCDTDVAFDLTTLLDGSQDGGGSWADTNTSGATITGNSADFTGVAAGTYQFTYTVTGTGPCGDDSEVVEVTVSEAPNAGVFTGTNGAACNDSAFDLTSLLDGSQDAGGSWSDDNTSGATITGNNADFTGIAAGTYNFTYTVTGAGSCLDDTETVTVDVTEAANAGVYVGTAGAVCDTDVAFDLTTLLDGSQDGGGSWADTNTSGATITGNSADFTGVAAGTYQFTYTVTGTGPCGDDSEVVEVTVSEAPNAGVFTGTNGAACNDSAFDLTSLLDGSQDAGGSWSDDNTSGATITGNNADFTGIAAGTYNFTYTVTGAGSCLDDTETVTVDVTEAANAGVYVGTAGAVCDTDVAFDLTTLLDGSQDGGGSWADTNTSGATITGNSADFTGVAAGTYQFTYTVTGTGPCGDDSEVVEVTVSEAPNAGVFTGTNGIVCNGATFNFTSLLDGSQDAGGSWSDDDTSGATITGSTGDFAGVASGTYNFTYIVNGSGSCTNATETITVDVGSLEIDDVVTQPASCGAEGTVELNVLTGSADLIKWTDENDNDVTGTDPLSFSATAGTYTLLVNDNTTNCLFTKTYNLVDPAPFTVDAVVSNQTECNLDNGSIDITINSGSGSETFQWTGPGIDASNENNEDQQDLTPGDYSVVVTDNGCTVTENFTVDPVESISATLSSELASCGSSDGTISVKVAQIGSNTYDVVLKDSSGEVLIDSLGIDVANDSVVFEGLFQASYRVIVTDNVTACSDSLNIVVNEDAPFIPNVPSVTNIQNCGDLGSISITFADANEPTSYAWVNEAGDPVGNDSPDLNGVEAGLYTVTLSDANCTVVISDIEITQPAECDYDCEDFRVTPITEAATCLGVDDGKMFFLLRDVNESSPELNFDIKPTGTDDSLYHRFTVANIGQGLIVEIDTTFATGSYTVVASDPNLDCTADTVNINIGTKTTLSATIDIEQPTCTISTGSISASIAGTTDSFEYILYFDGDSLTSNMTGVFADLEEGDYEIEFNNQSANSCGLSNRTFTIENTAVVDQSAVDINVSNPDCGEVFGSIAVSLNNLPSNYEFILVDGNDEEVARNSTGIFNDVAEGTYVVQFENVVDPGACPIADRGGIVIENDGSFSAVASEVENIVCFGDNTGSAIITLEGISTGFYSLDNGQLWTEFTSGNRISGLPAVNNLLVSDEPGTSDCELSVAVGIEYLSQPITLDGSIELITQASCTVSEQVGEINVPAVSGGVAPYEFSIDGKVVELDADRNIGGLARNVNQLTITDDTGCSENFDIRSIVSPNEVRAVVTEINPNNNCTDDPEGILVVIDEATIDNVPGPYNLILNRVNETTTSEYVLDINTNGSREFLISQFNIDENIPFIKGARYRWTVRAVDNDQACSADNFVTINGGAIIPTFDIEASDVACFQESGSIELFNIIADETIQLFIEVYEGNDVDPTETFTLNSIPESRRFVIDQSIYGMMTRGDYIVKLSQQPSNCSSTIESENASVFIDAPVAQLNVELVPEPNLPPGIDRERTDMNPMPTTRPDRANGSISIRLVEPISGANGYSAQIFLLTPLGGNNSSDYVIPTEPIEFDADRTITFANLLPGIYEIEYYDSFGCGLDGNRLVFDGEGSSDITVDFDRSPFIPNVFTPNNDGKNDEFRILNLPDNGAELIVTNRTGTIVYRDSNYRSSNLWDGGDNPDGIYFYQLTVDGNVQSGWVEIIRGKR